MNSIKEYKELMKEKKFYVLSGTISGFACFMVEDVDVKLVTAVLAIISFVIAYSCRYEANLLFEDNENEANKYKLKRNH